MLTTTVLVVGSGPIGLWLAYELRKANLDVLVIDSLASRDKRAKYSKALSISAGALETFESRGVAQKFLESGMPMKKAHFGGVLLDLNKDVLGTQHSCNLVIPQTKTEEILLNLCDNAGVTFVWGMEFCSLIQAEKIVSVTARRVAGDGHDQENVTIQATWVVGCDGTHSKVRESVSIAFEGTPSNLSVALADIQLSAKLPGNGILKDTAAGTSLVPIGDGVHHRFVSAIKPTTTTAVSDTPTLNEIKQLLLESFDSDFGAHSPLWFSRFGNACRVASSYRTGKVFLAGDAAHQLFPAGGQGMNLGFQDATSLSWRLAMVTNSHSLCQNAVERMLDSYSRERRAAAQAVNDNIQAQMALMTAKHPPEVALRIIFREALQNLELNAMWARRMTGFGDPTEPYTYPSSEIKVGQGNSPPGKSTGDSFIGIRVTSQICGNGMDKLFKATTLEKFVLVVFHRSEGVEIDVADLKNAIKRWTGQVTLLPMTVEERGKWKNIDAIMVRPDMRIAWIITSKSSIVEIYSSLAATLENWFGSR